MNKEADEKAVVRSGKLFGWGLAIFAMTLAPLLHGQENIFGYLQKMNGIYFVPIFSVVLVGMLSQRVPAKAARTAMITGLVVIASAYFIPPLATVVSSINDFHFLGIVFAYLVIYMFVVGEISPMEERFHQVDVKAVDMTPWPHAKRAGLALCLIVLTIYVVFADLSAL